MQERGELLYVGVGRVCAVAALLLVRESKWCAEACHALPAGTTRLL